MKEMNPGQGLKLVMAAGFALLTVSTEATDLKFDETGNNLPTLFQYDSGTWQNVVESPHVFSGSELFIFIATLKNGNLPSGSASISLLDSDNTVSDVVVATWTANMDPTGKIISDDFSISLYSGGGFPSPLPTDSIAEPNGMGKVLHIGAAPSDVNIFVNSPDGTTRTVPDGGMTLILLGTAVSSLGFIRRKLS